MAPLSCRGMNLFISADDFTFIAVPLSVVEGLYLLYVTKSSVRGFGTVISLAPWMFVVDMWISVFMLFLTIVIAVLSAQGEIMEARRHPKLLNWSIGLKIVSFFPCFLISMCVCICFAITAWCKAWQTPKESLGGWGQPLRADENYFWSSAFVLVINLLRLALTVLICFITGSLLVVSVSSAKLGAKVMTQMLDFLGIGGDMLNNIYHVTCEIFGYGTMELVSPSDMIFGFLLVAGQQLQGPFCPLSPGCVSQTKTNVDASAGGEMNSENQSPLLRHSISPESGLWMSTIRASTLKGVRTAPVPLKPDVREDVDALRRLTYYLPFAVGMYGVSMEVMSNAVYPFTSLISPIRCCRAVWRARPWHQPKVVGHDADVYGDTCWKLNESAFRRCLRDGSIRAAVREPTVLWATWENHGVGTSPPISISLDHAHRQIVISFRGTMDIKDAIADLGATPTFFDPLKQAGRTDRREAPFNDATDFFAHKAMVHCSEDAIYRISEAGVLANSLKPGGEAAGWDIICVGHSLGAGVACLVALMLHGSSRSKAGLGLDTRVQYVGFEPPGGLLSKRLSDETGKMGFMVGVCANDLISRLSIRAVQAIREDMLDLLQECKRSKVQLVLLIISRIFRSLWVCCCFRGLLFQLFEKLGGGALHFQEHDEDLEVSSRGPRTSFSAVRAHRSNASAEEPKFFNDLWPPSKVVYFRPVAAQKWCCGKYQVANEWMAEWVQPEDLHEIIVTPKSAELHFPNIITGAYLSAAVKCGAVDNCSVPEFVSSRTGSSRG
eukprot:TRINITY_DN8514_c0_g3_i1.p1 TRINITY_DN8514_c0_g3~~TRINITY_DN8514_c0_g3_i1.p1  ORF type:complete len:779 (-),score=103.01 TRINITY_DN8514_c0_g3_i1:30-2366(-)